MNLCVSRRITRIFSMTENDFFPVSVVDQPNYKPETLTRSLVIGKHGVFVEVLGIVVLQTVAYVMAFDDD